MDSWARLSMYESTELVRESFRRLRDRDLQLIRAQEVVSAFAQGREYFSAADAAGLLVRPLLQYYGVLSLSRGLVLFLNMENLRENALPQSHGLIASGWGSSLAQANTSPAELEVEVTKGTFGQLLKCTSEGEFISIFTAPYPNRLIFNPPPMSKDIEGRRFSLKQVFARIPELRALYERTFDEAAANYRGFVFNIVDAQTTVDVFRERKDLDEETVRRQLSIPQDVEIRARIQHNFVPFAPHLTYCLTHGGDRPFPIGLPQIEPTGDDTSIIAPFADNIRLSRLSRLFVLAYFLGTLARYHPTAWLSIMHGRQNGDRLLSMIRESMNIIQRSFPELTVRLLEPL